MVNFDSYSQQVIGVAFFSGLNFQNFELVAVYSGVLPTPTPSSLGSHCSFTQLAVKLLVDIDFQHPHDQCFLFLGWEGAGRKPFCEAKNVL